MCSRIKMTVNVHGTHTYTHIAHLLEIVTTSTRNLCQSLNVFSYVYWHLYVLFAEVSVQVFCPFLKLDYFFVLVFLHVFYKFWILIPIRSIGKYVLPLSGLYLNFVDDYINHFSKKKEKEDKFLLYFTIFGLLYALVVV